MSAPLVVNTADGLCWTLRTTTESGLPLYAPEGICQCPPFTVASLVELAQHGIVGTADVLPVPVGAEQGMTPHAARVRLTQYGERTETWATASYGNGTERALYAIALTLAAEGDELRSRVAELEAALDAKERTVDEDPICYALTGKACGRDLGPGYNCQRPAGHGGDCEPTPDTDDVTPQVAKLRALLAGQRDAAAVEAGEGR
jgi:hypothetical protein